MHNRAIEFEHLSKARTYLICDKSKIENGEGIDILGYFSIALKALHIPEGISIRTRKELDGFSGKIHNEPISDIPCYLIGQLARNDSATKESLSGKELIDEAHRIISASVSYVGGRYMMVECHNDPKILAFYKNNDFEEISQIPDSGVSMIQLLCKIEEYCLG